MFERPKLRDHLRLGVVPPDRVVFAGEAGHQILRGRSCALVAPLIDGRRTPDDIIAELSGDVDAAQVAYVLELLETRSLIDEATDAVPRAVSAYWNAFGVPTAVAAERLLRTPVRVVSVGAVPAAELEAELRASHVVVTDDDDAPLTVVLADDYLHPELERLNARALATGRAWMLCRPVGVELWLGPVFAPGRTGCWACLSQRLRANRDVEMFLLERSGEGHFALPTATLPATARAALSLAAAEAAKWVVLEGSETLEGKIVTFATSTLESRRHALVRRPQCEACGDGGGDASRLPEPVVLRSNPKRFVADGGHRTAAPDETLRRYEHHVSPLTGVVNQLSRVPAGGNPLIHVYVSGQNMARRHNSYDALRRNLRSFSCGKGISDTQARVSAIGEAIERYSGVFRGDEPRRLARGRDLGGRAVDPSLLLGFSERQYAGRGAWNTDAARRFNQVPAPYDPDAAIDWTPVWSLTRGEHRYLPTSCCYYSYPVDDERCFAFPDSNGSAAGNTVEEAVFQGLMEVFERDSVALWWYNRLRRPAVDLDSFADPYVDSLRAYHRQRRRELWVLDLTADMGVPAFVALSRRVDRDPQDIVFAPAAHLDPRIALLRSLTELNQMMGAMVEDDRPGVYAYDDAVYIDWWKNATVESQPYLLPDPALPPTRLDDFPRLYGDDLLDDIERCRALVESRGMEMLVLDQTRPDVGMPVVKVFVVGMRHFWARSGPGRLYDVPVAMGWLDRPLAEDELNPIEVFV
jgi:ribosomal protein S12 methylthiotransferase accessory factor